jgi:hypothetical protein
MRANRFSRAGGTKVPALWYTKSRSPRGLGPGTEFEEIWSGKAKRLVGQELEVDFGIVRIHPLFVGTMSRVGLTGLRQNRSSGNIGQAALVAVAILAL